MLRVGASSTAVMVSLRHDRSGAAPVVDRGGSFTTIGRFDGPERGWRADVAQSVERLTCNQQVAGSTPAIGSASRQRNGRGEVPERPKGADCKSAGERLRRFESSPLHSDLQSDPLTNDETMRCGSSSDGRARAFQARGRGFDSRLPLVTVMNVGSAYAHVAQVVEHFLGKEEVTGSNPVMGSGRAARAMTARRDQAGDRCAI